MLTTDKDDLRERRKKTFSTTCTHTCMYDVCMYAYSNINRKVQKLRVPCSINVKFIIPSVSTEGIVCVK